ncbi:hypothetical protein [Flavobacterium sp. SM2513]|uniref:hypothetical protein n=1 Tax=Flavobacterium sp. SM2513 TaxID=3424766 RepID=UPI003D7F2C3B
MMKLKMIIATLLVGLGLLSCSSDSNGGSVDTSCDDAASATLSAAIAYNNATDAESAAKCVAYKAALEAQIAVCGDTSGALSLIINSLGDCSDEAVTGSITVTVGSAPRTFNKNISITPVGITQHIYAEDTAGYYIEFDLAVNATGTMAIQNFNIHILSSDYNPLAVSEGGNWTSNITVNSDTKITGTFNGYVTSPTTGADLDLTSGVINLTLDF